MQKSSAVVKTILQKKIAGASNAFLRKLRQHEVECSCLTRLTGLLLPYNQA